MGHRLRFYVTPKYGLESVENRSKFYEMTIAEIQKEVCHLPEDQQDILAAYLTMLRRNRDPEWKDTLARRLGLQEPVAWADLGEIDGN